MRTLTTNEVEHVSGAFGIGALLSLPLLGIGAISMAAGPVVMTKDFKAGAGFFVVGGLAVISGLVGIGASIILPVL